MFQWKWGEGISSLRKWAGWMAAIVRLEEFGCGLEQSKLVGRLFQNGDASAGDVPLIGKILVRGKEKIELSFGEGEEFAVLDALPTHLLRGAAVMSGERLVERPWHTLIEKNSHAARPRIAARDCSSIRTAISRVTVGKHPRNSSIV